MRFKPNISKYGFTLLELLIVIAILAILSGAIIPLFQHSRARTRDVRRATDLKAILTALQQYKFTYGSYPCSGYQFSHNPSFLQPLIAGGYLSDSPRDPLNDATDPSYPYLNWYVYEYRTLKRVPGGTCGQIAVIGITSETEDCESLFGFAGFTYAYPGGKHCHIGFPPDNAISQYCPLLNPGDCPSIND